MQVIVLQHSVQSESAKPQCYSTIKTLNMSSCSFGRISGSLSEIPQACEKTAEARIQGLSSSSQQFCGCIMMDGHRVDACVQTREESSLSVHLLSVGSEETRKELKQLKLIRAGRKPLPQGVTSPMWRRCGRYHSPNDKMGSAVWYALRRTVRLYEGHLDAGEEHAYRKH
jgi:hypothetical protein